MKAYALALLTAVTLTGCGTVSATMPQAEPSTVQSQSHPGWGKKTWATITVPGEVMGHLDAQTREIKRQFERDYGTNKNYRLRLEGGLVASQDGFKTTYRGRTDMPEGSYARDFDIGKAPFGEYEYYLTVQAQAIEYRNGTYHQIWKTYGPLYVSNHGKNFRATAK